MKKQNNVPAGQPVPPQESQAQRQPEIPTTYQPNEVVDTSATIPTQQPDAQSTSSSSESDEPILATISDTAIGDSPTPNQPPNPESTSSHDDAPSQMNPNLPEGSSTPPAGPPSEDPLSEANNDGGRNMHEHFPHVWPGSFKVYSYSKLAVRTNLLPIIVLLLLVAVVGGATLILLNKHYANIVIFVAEVVIMSALISLLLAGTDGKKQSLGTALKVGFELFFKMLALRLVTTLILGVSLVLFIVPFFFVYPRLALVNYFLVDRNTGVFGSIKESWIVTQGHSSQVWGITGVTLLMLLPIVTIVGIVVSVYLIFMYSAAYAVLYKILVAHTDNSDPASI